MNFHSQSGRFIYPAQFLEKAFKETDPDSHYTKELWCEPYYSPGKPHWAFDNYRLNGSTGYDCSHLFYTQPGWGQVFERRMGRDKVKCVTYACDPDVHKPEDASIEFDVGFIGEPDDTTGERKAVLEELQRNFRCYFSETTPTERIGAELSRCAVVFNHIRYEEVNIRFFEELAIGAQVVSHSPALGLFAQRGKHFLSYRSPSEAVWCVRYLLDHPEERIVMARRARAHALQFHTYKHRAREIIEFLL